MCINSSGAIVCQLHLCIPAKVCLHHLQYNGVVLSGFFSALMLLVGWQEGHRACKTSCHLFQRFCSRRSGGRKMKGNWLSDVHLKMAIKMEVLYSVAFVYDILF